MARAAGIRFPRSFAWLGDVVDLRIEHKGRRWRQSMRKFLLCSDTTRKVLWLVPRPNKRKRVPLEGQKEAADLYRSWSQLVPDEAFAGSAKVGTPKLIGDVNSIAYRSDKWSGKTEVYEHDFTRPPVIEKAGGVYRIRGPSVRVTPRGITG